MFSWNGTRGTKHVCMETGEWELDPRNVSCVYPATTAIKDHTGIR